MIYTPKIQKAINFSIKVHQQDQNQTRKGKTDPYIIHPLTVGLILAKTGAQEDVIVAGILHDTIEDCEPHGSVTKELLEKEFGKDVAEMVNDVTEQDKSLPWEERKRFALEHVKHMKKNSVLVKSADVLHNMTDQISDYEKEGDKMFLRFNASKEKQLLRYTKLIHELKNTWQDNPLLSDLEENLKIVVDSWSFGSVKTSTQPQKKETFKEQADRTFKIMLEAHNKEMARKYPSQAEKKQSQSSQNQDPEDYLLDKLIETAKKHKQQAKGNKS